ncbi:MAG: EcsC family protein [Lachnospiraceae bacterium]|nr:EcsC family protein [Lachnospiraceae bacterium]
MGNRKQIVTAEDIQRLLDTCYAKCLDGIPMVSESVEELAEDYLKKNKTKDEACKKMVRNQVAKCTTSGALTSLGGIITLPVAIPANVGSVLYIQMRMVACIAHMSGYDLRSDQSQTFVYACLAGVAVNQVVKKASIKFGEKAATNLIKKIPGKTLTRINQKVGFRFLTKFGEKGIINFGKLVPGVGAAIGGGLDFAETKIIAKRAYKWFVEGDFSIGKNEEVIEVDEEDLVEAEKECPKNQITTDDVVAAIVEEVLSSQERIVSSVYEMAVRIGKEKFNIDDIEKEVACSDGESDVFGAIYNGLRRESRNKENAFSMRAVPHREMQWGIPYNIDYIFKKRTVKGN